MNIELVAVVVSLVLVIVVALLKDNVSESEAERSLRRGQNVLNMMQVVMQIAQDAVLMVEGQLKEDGSKTPEELHQAAVKYSAEALQALGVTVDAEVLSMLATMVEAAYQRLKIRLVPAEVAVAK